LLFRIQLVPLQSGAANGVVDAVDFAVTSADLDTTLVIYMGLGTLPSLTARLIENGFPKVGLYEL
jgi:uroporphyrin-III C-methyltransferase